MKKKIFLLLVFLVGCSVIFTIKEKECIFIAYPEKDLVIAFSNDLKLEEMPYELKNLGYDMDDLISVQVGDSVSVLREIEVEAERSSEKINYEFYIVYEYYNPSPRLLSELNHGAIYAVYVYVQNSVIKIIKASTYVT